MAYKQMIAACGVDCASCVHYLANENTTALVQVEKWSALLKFIRRHQIAIKGPQSITWMDHSEIFLLVVTQTLLGWRRYPNYLIWFSKHVRVF